MKEIFNWWKFSFSALGWNSESSQTQCKKKPFSISHQLYSWKIHLCAALVQLCSESCCCRLWLVFRWRTRQPLQSLQVQQPDSDSVFWYGSAVVLNRLSDPSAIITFHMRRTRGWQTLSRTPIQNTHCAVLTAPPQPNFPPLEWVSAALPELFREIFSGNKGLGLHSYQIRQIHTLLKNVWTRDTEFTHPGEIWPCNLDKWPSQFLAFLETKKNFFPPQSDQIAF